MPGFTGRFSGRITGKSSSGTGTVPQFAQIMIGPGGRDHCGSLADASINYDPSGGWTTDQGISPDPGQCHVDGADPLGSLEWTEP